jgi:uncharacterized protein
MRGGFQTPNHNCQEKKLYAREFHPIKDKETILVYDIENFRLIELNEIELSVLDNIKQKSSSITALKKKFPSGKAVKVENAVNELIKEKMLDYHPLTDISGENIHDYERKRLEKLKDSQLRQICLNVTHRCNLNCDYCYGGDGSYGGPARHMSRNTAEQAVDFLMKASGNSHSCRITFFGGEPLLNFHLVKHIVQYARKKAAKLNKEMFFGITTNGVLLDDENCDFLIKEKIEVTFSFDGPKGIQDKNRPFKSNKKKSSYDVIYPKILKFIEKAEKNKCFYGFRATITRPGLINMQEVGDFFNCFKTKQVYYDTAEYKNGMSSGGLAISEDDLRIYRQQVKEMAEEYKADPLKPRNNSIFSGPLKSIQQQTRRTHFCKSPGCSYIGVSAQGDIFPCHRFVGGKETKLGNVWQGFDREKWLKKYVKAHIFNSQRCSACWIRYFCGGMCPATNYFLGGDLVLSESIDPEPVHCKMKKIVFEEAVLLYCSISGI